MAGLRTGDQIVQVWWIDWAYSALVHGQIPSSPIWLNYPVGVNAGVNGSMLMLGTAGFADYGHLRSRGLVERPREGRPVRIGALDVRRPAALDELVAGRLLRRTALRLLHLRDDAGVGTVLHLRAASPDFFLLLYEGLVRQQWSAKRTGILLAVVCAAQFFVSPEIFASTVLMGHQRDRRCICWLTGDICPSSAHYLKRSVSVGHWSVRFFWSASRLHALRAPGTSNGVPNPPSDLALLTATCSVAIVPGDFQRLATSRALVFRTAFTGLVSDVSSGVPLRSCARRHRRTGARARHRAARRQHGALSLILSFGSTLYIGGHDTHVPIPIGCPGSPAPAPKVGLSSRFCLFTILFGCSDCRLRAR